MPSKKLLRNTEVKWTPSLTKGQATPNYLMSVCIRHWCSPVNLLHIFRTHFPRNTSEWMLLIRAVDYKFFASRSWHSQDIVKQIGKKKRDDETKVDVHISVLKLLQAK